MAVVLGAVSFACAGGPGGPPGAVHVLTAKGTVNPVMDRYIDRGVDAAEDEQAAAVVIRLNTPGGLSSSMDNIRQRIHDSNVPVVTYVWPPGGQAASAGTFIAYASHVAAMAPSTVIGSATPVDAGGGDIEGDLGNKVLENAVAKIRGDAQLRGRNADWAESAVRDGISAEYNQALQLGVVEYVAGDLDDLLRQMDGREVELRQGGPTVVLRTAEAPVVYNDRNFAEDVLDILADPNIAFLLISLGSLALFIEIVNPGQIFPGVFGVIALVLGFFALSVLPFNWAGVVLILFAFVLFGLELFVVSHGILGIGGIVALILGGLLLTSGNPPEFQVSRWLVFGLGAALALFVLYVLASIIRIRRMPAQMGMQTMVGQEAIARSALDPKGFVFVSGEYWSAESEDGSVQPGERVVITEVQGLQLKVKKQREGG
ncbi:MAG: nodulation protein NfeD [Chloroflexi bacterium]|nr:nodulation protein NfeD [Chloroflexota bacterium]